MKNFMAKPVTWGGYFKLSGICALISAIIIGAGYVYAFWDNIVEWAAERRCIRSFNKAMEKLLKEQEA